jgi:hypothetical protein
MLVYHANYDCHKKRKTTGYIILIEPAGRDVEWAYDFVHVAMLL